ncbi:TolC family protein [Bryobacter aggregatus]|uniref:TolC family protein n=1 Tax=Bryobacter aggregatus TaxID=360054 RepID=UPI00138E2F39|nr:TolC family protein [Bryobacter aggregatus]
MRRLVWLLALPLSAAMMPLSLPKAIEIATAPNGNLRLQITRETIAQAEARRRQALGAFLPNLDGSISASSQTQNLAAFGFQLTSVLPFTIPTFVGPFTVVDYRVSATQSILDLSAIERYRASKLQREVARAETRNTTELTIQQVARAYVLQLKAEASVDTAKANVDLAERLVQLAESQKRAGTGTGIEVTRSRVQLQNEKQRLIAAQNDREQASLDLKRAIGIDLAQEIELTDRMNDGSDAAVTAEAAVETALEQRPDLLAQQRRQGVAQRNVKSIAAERLPSLAASGAYGVIGNGSTMVPTRSVGVAVRVPIFDGGRREARIAEGGVLERQERLRVEDLRKQIELEVRVALNNVKNARAQIEAARLGLELAENEVEQAQRRTEAGVANSVELTDAQTRLARARDNNLGALYLFNLARIDVAAATGSMEQAVAGMVKK